MGGQTPLAWACDMLLVLNINQLARGRTVQGPYADT